MKLTILALALMMVGCAKKKYTVVPIRPDIGSQHTFVVTDGCLMDSWQPKECIDMPDGTYTEIVIYRDGGVQIRTFEEPRP